jgi:hypothetical protein
MTMQVTHAPKPRIFGKGYGKHIATNLKVMRKFFWLGWKSLVNTFVPFAFYEVAHWEVIDLYYAMRGYRHGTKCNTRCEKCGSDLPSADEVHDLREAKKIIAKLRAEIANHTCVEPVYPDRAGGELHGGETDSE